jgi:RNase H-fold protein (predicted Holliday junction resolvase)
MTVLGIDPGREKCGVAVCARGRILARAIVPPAEVPALVTRWTAEYGIETVVVGGGTGSNAIVAVLAQPSAPDQRPVVAVEDERATTLAARHRYFKDHPPRGWRRLLPLSLQVPSEPYDDYAAAVIAERYVKRRSIPNLA